MSLTVLNWSASGLHALLGIFFSIYFPIINKNYPNQGLELSIRDHVLHFTIQSDSSISTSWKSQVISTPSVVWIQRLVVSFFFITSLFHVYYAISPNYPMMVKNGNNYVRWIEYSFTSTIMLYVIAMLCNVKDANIYYLIGVCNIIMITQGQAVENAVQQGGNWILPMVSGFVLLLVTFSIIARNYIQRMNQENDFIKANPSAPYLPTTQKWISYMMIVLFILFSCFGLVSLFGVYSGSSYQTMEIMYTVLSFLSKASLGFFVAYGSIQLQQKEI